MQIFCHLSALLSLVVVHSALGAPVSSGEDYMFMRGSGDRTYRLAHHKGEGHRNDGKYQILPISYHGVPDDYATWDRRASNVPRKPVTRPGSTNAPRKPTSQPGQGYPDNFEGTGWYNLW